MRVITIGRDQANDKIINDPCASRHHLQIIQHDDGHFTLNDFGSTNGTFVNGQKISGEILLNDIDIVRIGNTTIPWRIYFDEAPISNNQPQKTEATPVSQQPPEDVARQTAPLTNERHGFVTFWLGFCIAVNIISIIRAVLSFQNISTLSTVSDKLASLGVISIVTSIFFGLCIIVGYILLLNWHKIGFWLNVGVSVMSVIVTILISHSMSNELLSLGIHAGMNDWMSIILITVSIVVLWAVLQIKKNGVTCWKYLK